MTDCISTLQSINSEKHLQQSSFTGQFFMPFCCGVYMLYSLLVHGPVKHIPCYEHIIFMPAMSIVLQSKHIKFGIAAPRLVGQYL